MGTGGGHRKTNTSPSPSEIRLDQAHISPAWGFGEGKGKVQIVRDQSWRAAVVTGSPSESVSSFYSGCLVGLERTKSENIHEITLQSPLGMKSIICFGLTNKLIKLRSHLLVKINISYVRRLKVGSSNLGWHNDYQKFLSILPTTLMKQVQTYNTSIDMNKSFC